MATMLNRNAHNWRTGAALVVAGLLVVASFVLGRQSAVSVQLATVDIYAIQEVRAALEIEQARLDASRRDAEQQQLAMSRELGRLQAGLERLNALGQTLSEMALLDPSVFDFSAEPPVGGPATSAENGDTDLLAFDTVSQQLELRRRELDILEHMLVVSQLQQQSQPRGWPVKSGWISSIFGARHDPFNGRKAPHYGVDFAAAEGSDISAVAAGVVVFSGKRTGFGNVVEINHGNGYVTRYAHNKSNVVAVGDRVERGQTIALVGKSGRATGPHLHLEVFMDGKRINPLKVISKNHKAAG